MENSVQKDYVIDIQNVSMKFIMEKNSSNSLKEYIIKAISGKSEKHELYALNDVSFHLEEGEIFGIVGVNGSGKSTLLKLIAGVMTPTSGEIKVDRNKVQLLSLGSGFDQELTARENVYLNGALIGYTKEFIDENYDKIVEFAELDGFMDEKIKNFSSGMISRLAFSIATAAKNKDILILDEVLSVGDMFFRRKSEARIQEMIKGGATVLLVSHSLDVIKKNCTKVMWLNKGVVECIDAPSVVCEKYIASGK